MSRLALSRETDCHSTPTSGCPLRLGLDDPDHPLVDIQQVVRAPVARSHDCLADGDAGTAEQVQVLLPLDEPVGAGELAVDLASGAPLGRDVVLVHGPPKVAVRAQSSLTAALGGPGR
jgi:hypothetical protein